jgi:hypothetical protein
MHTRAAVLRYVVTRLLLNVQKETIFSPILRRIAKCTV